MQNILNMALVIIALGAVFLYAAIYDRVKNPARQKTTAIVCFLCGLILLVMYFASRNY